MRKYKLMLVVVTMFVVISGIVGYAFVRHQQQVHKKTAYSVDQVKEKQLADWQQKVKMWRVSEEQKKQAASAQQQTDLQKQGIYALPETGRGNISVAFFLSSIFGIIAYYVVHKYRASA